MNTVSQTIAKLVILPLFGGAVITGVALATVDSAAAATEWVPPAPAASTAPARPDLIENEISVDAVAAAPAAAAPTAAAPAAAAPRSQRHIRQAGQRPGRQEQEGQRQVQQGQFSAPVSVAVVTKAPVQ